MNYKVTALTGIVVLALVIIIAAPIGPLPGFFIGGNVTNVPEQWQDTSDVHEVKLKVPGMPSRVVTIWVIDHQSDLHVMSAGDSGWTSMLGEGAPVELRIGDQTYALEARRITTDTKPIVTAYIAKYAENYPSIVGGFPSVEEGLNEFKVYRLEK